MSSSSPALDWYSDLHNAPESLRWGHAGALTCYKSPQWHSMPWGWIDTAAQGLYSGSDCAKVVPGRGCVRRQSGRRRLLPVPVLPKLWSGFLEKSQNCERKSQMVVLAFTVDASSLWANMPLTCRIGFAVGGTSVSPLVGQRALGLVWWDCRVGRRILERCDLQSLLARVGLAYWAGGEEMTRWRARCAAKRRLSNSAGCRFRL